MSLLEGVDLVLAMLLLGLAWHILHVGDLFQAGVLFIVFGLLMAIAWVRLQAPDIALAEAAIGAGVTGALYLNTLAGDRMDTQDPDRTTTAAQWTGWLAALLATILGGLMIASVAWQLVPPRPPTPRLAETGQLTNAVTAVLLDVRSYDTLLETAVLVEALVGVWILARTSSNHRIPVHSPLLQGMTRLIGPVMITVAGAVLWNGATSTGGAFQSAAILAAAGILLRLSGFHIPLLTHRRTQAGLAVLGTAFFLSVGIAAMLVNGGFLDYPPAWQKALVTSIEAMATLSIAVVLLMLFEATTPQAHPKSRERT